MYARYCLVLAFCSKPVHTQRKRYTNRRNALRRYCSYIYRTTYYLRSCRHDFQIRLDILYFELKHYLDSLSIQMSTHCVLWCRTTRINCGSMRKSGWKSGKKYRYPTRLLTLSNATNIIAVFYFFGRHRSRPGRTPPVTPSGIWRNECRGCKI